MTAPTADEIRENIKIQIATIEAEADQLRAALSQLDGEPAQLRNADLSGQRARRPRAGETRRPRTARQRRRARTPGTRDQILEHLRDVAGATAGEVAASLGLGRASVSTTLSKMSRTGEVIKLARGYAINNGGSPQPATSGSPA